MKKPEITTNELELIFNELIEQTPLISEEQVISLLNSLPNAPTPNTFGHFLKTHLNTLIISAVILCAVSIAIFRITNSENKIEQPAVENSVHENASASLVKQDTSLITSAAINSSSASKTSETSATTPAETIQSAPNLSGAGIYKRFDKKPQVFSIRADRDTVIVCKEGTTISIKAKSFVSEKTGEVITGKVKLAVTEYYKISDIVQARLSTTSDDKIIETGGMLYLSAKSAKEKCLLKSGERLEIGFPYSEKKDDMILFSGAWKNDQINWTSVSANSGTETKLMISDDSQEEVFMVVEEMPEFPGGITSLRRYVQENTHYPYSALSDKLAGTVYVNFVVDQFGYITSIKVVRPAENILDKAAAYLVSQMPAWKPGKQRGQAVPVSYTVPVTFRIAASDLTDEGIRRAKQFEEKLKDLKYNEATHRLSTDNKKFTEEFETRLKDGKLSGADILATNRYVLGAYQLGWINCDRFVNLPNPKVSFSVLIDDLENTEISVIFHRFRAVIRGQAEPDRINFKAVPVGEKITIVALKTIKNEIHLAVQEAEITNQALINLDFRPVTPDWLKKEMEKLNRFAK